MKLPPVVVVLLLLSASLSAQSNQYSAWSNFPQSPNFFPIVLWLQNTNWSMGTGAPYSSVAAAMKGTKMNTLLAVDNGGGGGYPVSCGVDSNNQFQNLIGQGIYLIAASDGTNGTSPTSVACLQQLASNLSASQYLIGYNLGDEPSCTTQQSMSTGSPSPLATIESYDTTRPFLWNMQAYLFASGTCSGGVNTGFLNAISIGSFDNYPLIGPWAVVESIPNIAPNPHDSMWIQGGQVASMVTNGRSGQPIWAYVDTGTSALDYPTQNGSSCSESSNLCTQSSGVHYFRAPAELVNAEVWMTLINGAMGIEYFCDDTSLSTGQTAYNFCLGATTSSEASISGAIASNLTYINNTILSFAPQLNSAVLGRCTMNNGTAYTSYTTSCSNGILTMSSGTASVPGSAIVKNYNGTPYLFADSDRNGSATMTFTLSGHAGETATVVYDSNAQYDPAHSSVGSTFTLDSNGRFSDTFGANGHNYQPKIYKISGGVATPTNLAATAH